MPRTKKKVDDRKIIGIEILVDKVLGKQIRRAAKSKGLQMSTWCRLQIVNELERMTRAGELKER
jgi:hypothetical protein